MEKEQILIVGGILILISLFICLLDRKNGSKWIAFIGILMAYILALDYVSHKNNLNSKSQDFDKSIIDTVQILKAKVDTTLPNEVIVSNGKDDNSNANPSSEKIYSINNQQIDEVDYQGPVQPEQGNDYLYEECVKNKTGDICFINNTTTKLRIYLKKGNEGIIDPYNSQNGIVNSNQKLCYYDLPVGAYKYQVNYNFNNNNPDEVGYLQVPSSTSGGIKIERCKLTEESFNFKD